MRYFDEHRRRIKKHDFIRGYLKDISCEENILNLPDCAGIDIKELKILGNTLQDGIPSPNEPSQIINTGDNGTSITLQNKNLCNVSPSNETHINGQYELTYPSVQEFKIKWLGASAIVGYRVELEPNTTYVFSFNINIMENSGASYIRLSWEAVALSTYEFKRFTYSANGSYSDSFVFNSGTHTHMYVCPWVYQSTIQGTLQVEKGSSPTAYEPYFSKSITIPHEVTLENGTKVEINLTKVSDYADTLEITKGKIFYKQYIWKYTFKGNEVRGQSATNYQGWNRFYSVSISDTINAVSRDGYSNYFEILKSFGTKSGLVLGYGGSANYVGFNLPAEQFPTVTSVNNWLKKCHDNDNPVTVITYLSTPIEYDITDIIGEFEGALHLPYDSHVTIEVTSALSPTGILCKYYSLRDKEEQNEL